MAFIKPFETGAGQWLAYWRIVSAHYHFDEFGAVTVDVALGAWLDPEARAAGKKATGVYHEFRLEPHMLSGDPNKSELYTALKQNDPFFADASNDEGTPTPARPAPPAKEPRPERQRPPPGARSGMFGQRG